LTGFDRDTAAEPLGGGRYRVRFDPAWRVVRGPNGGYVAAVLVRAIRAEVGEGRPLRSLTVHYLSAPQEAEAEVEVRVERAGRSLTTVSVRCDQDGRTIALALAALATAYPAALERADAAMPDVPAPEAIAPPAARPGFDPPPFARNFELRPALGWAPFSGGEHALTGGWIRFRDERPLDEAALVALCDAWWPALFSVVEQPLVAPTIDLTVHLRAELPRPHDDVLLEARSDVVRDGFVEEDVRIFARDGTLLAQSRQLALAL
jgi:acyl-CoA thioesterase